MKLAHWFQKRITCFYPQNETTPRVATRLMTVGSLFLLIVLSACTEQTANNNDSAVLKASMTSEEMTPNSLIQLTDEDVAELKEQFTKDKSWFRHNHWGDTWPQRRTLTADVNESGYYYLSSNYYNKYKIRHEYIEVEINGQKYSSQKAESKDRVTEKRNGKIFEVNSYSNYSDDGIFKAIAQSKEGETIKIRFVGKNGTKVDDELSPEDRQALVDCFKLSMVLRQDQKKLGSR